MAPYYRGRPVWVCRWVREAGPCASENDTRGVCTGALRVRHPHLGQSLLGRPPGTQARCHLFVLAGILDFEELHSLNGGHWNGLSSRTTDRRPG